MTDIVSEWKKSYDKKVAEMKKRELEKAEKSDLICETAETLEEEEPKLHELIIPEKHEVPVEHIPLIEPIKEKREFASPAEFDAYYQEHKEELSDKTTHKLNKMFVIPGYRVTKIKGVLSLKNIPQSRVTSTMKIDTLEEKTNEMKDRLNLCINTINKVLDMIQK